MLEDIRRNAQVAKLASSRYMEMLLSAKLEKEKEETARARRELKKAEKRVEELDKILAKLYEDQPGQD